MPKSYLERVLRARVYDLAIETPLSPAPLLSAKTGNEVLLKREDLQPVFSFKIRGAANKIADLSPEERARGVVAASAGNHGQGVAMAAARAGIEATIVMPRTTPPIKVEAVRRYGADVLLEGDSYDEAYAAAKALEEENGATFLHPYDDPAIIAGQGTVGLEIIRQTSRPPDAIFVPVGGGGLIAGVAAVIKSVYPDTKVIGVEPEDAACMHAALEAGERVVLEKVGIFVDGVAVRQVGEEPFRIARECVDEVVLVTTDQVCAGIKDIFEDTRSISEPAGALAVAGAKVWAQRNQTEGATLVAIVSGANMNFDRLRYVAESADVGSRRELLLAVSIPEEPGSFRAFCTAIGDRSVTEFNYRYAGPGKAHVFVGIELGNLSERRKLIETLETRGYGVVDLSGDEMAKLHVRHMVGGRNPDVTNERVYRFIFPERPGALLRFLTEMRAPWNVSLFHYRNHGAAYGNVLVGIQVPEGDGPAVQTFLEGLGYAWHDESENPAYRLFL
ncbi:MAG: threonine dehydratase [Bradymonadia bacterium]|jgi:threonine dehydratase